MIKLWKILKILYKEFFENTPVPALCLYAGGGCVTPDTFSEVKYY